MIRALPSLTAAAVVDNLPVHAFTGHAFVVAGLPKHR
jgi:hypothetical protein